MTIPRGETTALWLEVASALADELAVTAQDREKNRVRPVKEIQRLRETGLLTLPIPRELGGGGLSVEALALVVREVTRGDASVGALLGVHYISTTGLWLSGLTPAGEQFLRDVVQHGWFLGVVFNPYEPSVLTAEIRGDRVVLNGRKTFCTGAPLADRMIIMARRKDTNALVHLAIPHGLPGVEVSSDWDPIGWRLADSSSINFDNVEVSVDTFIKSVDGESLLTLRQAMMGNIVLLFYSNYYVGPALAAFEVAKKYTQTTTRAWVESGVEKATDDPYLQQLYGEVYIKLQSAIALLDRAGTVIQHALDRGDALTEQEQGDSSIAIFTARVVAAREGLDAASKLFEAMGARSSFAKVGFDRYWRDLRTHTLHHPLAYKVKGIGNFILNGEYPPVNRPRRS